MKILVAEDDALTMESIHACLRTEGFTTLLAQDGKRALQLWKQQRPDLLCLDIMMPVMDGFEVCRRVRAEDARVPVLFLSAKSEEIDVVVGLELGADDFIRKPFGKRELLARVRAALRRASAREAPPKSFQMHDITVYPSALIAVRDAQEIELSPREVAIMSLLFKRAGEPVNRDDLLDQCWGQNYFPESRTLDQHIAKLRKAIEQDPARPSIVETVRGVGYRFRPR